MSPPLISCVVPVHDGEAHLGQAIDSILAQTHRPLEVVVVDNASTDRSPDIAREYGFPVRLIERDMDGGPAVARMVGVAAARGELIGFLDHDDLWAPSKLERQLVHLEGPPRLQVSFCAIENFWDDGLEDERRRWAAAGRLRGTYVLQTALARRSVFTTVPLEGHRPHMQHVAWLLALRSADVHMGELSAVLARRRRHRRNITRLQMTEHFDELLAMLHERVSTSTSDRAAGRRGG
jgi:glycosyltransferase involved in cell wall biosynthesis